MPADVQEILRADGALKAQTDPWRPSWQLIGDTMMPAYNDITTSRTPGDVRTSRLMDTTGLQGNILLANHIAGAVTNFQTRWFNLRMAYEPLNGLKSVKVWTDSCAKTMQDKLSATTTPQAFHEAYLQFSGMGTKALFVDEYEAVMPGSGRTGLLSRSLPIGTYCTAENAAGEVDTLYRDLELSPRMAIQHFGIDQVHPNVRKMAEKSDSAYTPMRYIHAVYPRKDRDPTNERQQDMPYASCYLDVTHKHLCREGGYRWFPYMVSRWQKIASFSPWGFGPGHIALPEVLTLNQMDRDVLRALQFHIMPPWWTDDPDAVGSVMLLPGMVNVLAKGSNLQPMQAPGQFNISHLGMEERRQRVRQAFYMDQLITLPAADTTGKMTAYEVAQRIAYMSRLMGPAFMRLLSEFLNPFLDITFGTMLEADELPQPPDEVIIAAVQGYGKIQVDYEGPLAKAQQGDEGQAIDMTLTLAERVVALTGDQHIMDDYFDIGELLRRGHKIYGAPAVIMREPQDTEQRQQARQQAQAEAQQNVEVREDVKALGPASQMVKALTPAPQGAAA